MRTRVALHTGEAQQRDGDYYGGTVNRAARIRGLAAGGEILVSRATHDLVADVLPEGVRLVDVGEHEIKGLRRNENLFLVEAPGIDSGFTRSSAAEQPTRREDLVGRAGDVARAVDAIATPGIATITGPGGIGKTRLMRETLARAHSGEHRFERVYTVELAGARERMAVESGLQEAVVRDDASITAPAGQRRGRAEGAIAQVTAALGSRRVLVAIDNCEHLLDAVADMLEDVITQCPNVSILATSREPLGLPGERVLMLDPLALPDGPEGPLDRLANVDSLQLLLRRARDAGSDLELTRETADPLVALCQLLDGVPLALELAAARLRSASPADLNAKLAGQLHLLEAKRGDPRHRSLYGAIDWSYQLLDEAQRLLLRRLGIFVGGCTLAAAEEVCADEPDGLLAAPEAVYVNLAELVSKSLVMFERDRGRYRLLEPVRLFARERLEEDGELVSASQRHSRWVRHLARATLAGQVFGGQMDGSGIRADLDNVHAALDWLDANGDHDTFLRIVALLGFTWFASEWRRGHAVTERAVELSAGASPVLRGSVLLSRGIVEQRATFYESRSWLEEARAIFAATDNRQALAWTTFFLGRAFLLRDHTTAAAHMSAAGELFRELGQPVGEVWSELNLGNIAELDGDLELAREYFDRALATATETGLDSARGSILGERADIALAQHDFASARAQLREAIELERRGGDVISVASHLSDLARVEVVAGDFPAARGWLVAAMRASIENDDEWQIREALVLLAVVHLEEGNPHDARRVLAATGWDVEPPPGALDVQRTVVAQSWVRLESVLVAEYDEDAAEGRRASVFETARAFLADAPTH